MPWCAGSASPAPRTPPPPVVRSPLVTRGTSAAAPSCPTSASRPHPLAAKGGRTRAASQGGLFVLEGCVLVGMLVEAGEPHRTHAVPDPLAGEQQGDGERRGTADRQLQQVAAHGL